jgi:branched-chain amino acid transport system permease protein
MDRYLSLFVFGITTGAIFGLMALGIVMIYRSTGVLNLAHGAMAMAPAYIVHSLHNGGVPVLGAAVGGLVFAALLGLVVERLMRPLTGRSVLTKVVMTVGILLLVVSLFEKIYTTDPRVAPTLFPDGGFRLPGLTVRVTWEQLGVLAVTLVLSAALAVFFRASATGIAMRAAAENRRSATLMGVNPDRLSALAWVMGSVLAGVAGILISPSQSLQPFVLVLTAVPAFVAALVARLESLPGAVLGAIVVGVLYYEAPELPALRGIDSGVRELAILAVAIGFLVTQSSRLHAERA